MNKKRITVLLLLFLAMIGITSALISAWLTDTKETPSTTFTVGDIEYEWVEGETAESPIVPGQNLIASVYSLANSSNVDSELRVEIIANYTLSGQETANDAILLFEDITLMTGWNKNEDDGKWYYEVGGDAPTTILPSLKSINVIETLILDGFKVGNTYTGAQFVIIFKFEAKQKDHVTWSELGDAEIDFGDGI